MLRTIGTLCALFCASAQAVAGITISPSPSANGDYTVGWTPHPMADERYELKERLNSGGWYTYRLSSGTTSKSFAGKADGTWTYRLTVCESLGHPDEIACGDSGYEPRSVVVAAEIPAAPGYDEQEAYEYLVRQGDHDNDGRIDLFVQRESGGAAGNGALESFFLVQGPALSFSATAGTAAERSMASSWSSLPLDMDRLDVNADGFLDLVVRDLSVLLPGADDQLVFASGELFAPAPAGVRALDDGVRLFVANAMDYYLDNDYFRVNVPVETVTRIEWEYDCEIYWWGQYPEWRCDWYPVVVEEEVMDTTGFSTAAIELWQRYERFESGEGGAEAIVDVLETLLGVIIGGAGFCDSDDSLLPVEVQCRLFESTAAALALATATGHPSTAAARQPNIVYVTGHRVRFTSEIHLALEFSPPNFAEPPAFTLSAGPSVLHVLPGSKLVSQPGRPEDRPEFNHTVGTVLGRSGTDTLIPVLYWIKLVEADQNYCDGLDYDPHPEAFSGTGYNSNGYIAGIVQATGGVTGVDFSRYVGGSTLVPGIEFLPDPPCGN